MDSKIRQLELTSTRALQIIREAAKNSANVFLTAHAQMRMSQRKITMTQVLRCLRQGKISEGPARDHIKGGWKCSIEHYTAGESLGVSVAIATIQATGITVITVYLING